MSVFYQKTKKRITHLSKHPFLVETVDEEDGGLSESHEEVTDRQVHDEVVWQVTKLLVTTHTHRQRTGSLMVSVNSVHIFFALHLL